MRFDELPGPATRIGVRLTYKPPAGVLGHAVAAFFGADPKKALDDDMVRFQSLIEEGKTTAHGEPVTREELEPPPPAPARAASPPPDVAQGARPRPRRARRRAPPKTGDLVLKQGGPMPEKKTIERARRARRQGKAASTAAGEFVHEEIEHVREGKHGARSTKQAIAIGLSKARRAGVPLKPPAKGEAKQETREKARRDYAKGRSGAGRKPSPKRARATRQALKREGRAAASRTALSRHARRVARRPGKRK